MGKEFSAAKRKTVMPTEKQILAKKEKAKRG